MHVARKIRVETYLQPDDVDKVAELAKERGSSSSDVIRQATIEVLRQEGYKDE